MSHSNLNNLSTSLPLCDKKQADLDDSSLNFPLGVGKVNCSKLFKLKGLGNLGRSTRRRDDGNDVGGGGRQSSQSKSPKQVGPKAGDEKMIDKTKHEMTAFELKEEGNKLYSLYKYDEAASAYTKAISMNPMVAAFYTNRALCYLRTKNWDAAAEDCRRALELEPNLIKGHFFLGQALLELEHYDESILHLHRALDMSKDSKRNFGDEIAYQMRLARKKRWNMLEEKRIKQEIELQSYLNILIEQDRDRQKEQLNAEVQAKTINDSEMIKSTEQAIDNNYEEKISAVNDLFAQIDDRRKKREVPDCLCGKISFEIMQDPVVTPSGITYDRKDIEEHLQRVGHFDPVTRSPLEANQLTPNLALKEVIDTFLAENEWAHDY